MAEEITHLTRSQFACQKCNGQDEQGPFLFFAKDDAMRKLESGVYVSSCPQCGEDAEELWYCANLRRWKPGPKTPEGKLKSAMRGYTTGQRYATGAIPRYLPPAKPGRFAECDHCQDFDECVENVEAAKGTCRYVACHRQTETMAKFRNAHFGSDPTAIRLVAAENQARMQMVMNACFKNIFDKGVMITEEHVVDGKTFTTEKINPAINESIKILEKMGFTLADWTLTPKSKEAKAALEGYLAGQAAAKGQSMDEFLAKHQADMKSFHDALARGNENVKADTTLQEAEQEAEPGE